jgi:Chalcone isomerase-like
MLSCLRTAAALATLSISCTTAFAQSAPRSTAAPAAPSATPAAPAAAGAKAVELAGVSYAPTVALGNAQLALNGAGIRYKAVFKVYTAGLYLSGKAATPEAVYSAAGPKRMHIAMLRDIDANELGKLFTDGMQKNASREEFGKSIPGTLKLAEIFAAKKRLSAGDSFYVDYIPGTGTVVSINGKPAADPIVEPVFFTALMKIWLGANPADWQLKDALLGLPKG